MGLLKQLLGRYMGGSHQSSGGHGNKHGGGGKHGYGGYSGPVYNPNNNPPQNIASGRNCPRCNTNNLYTAKFCQQCGNTLSSDCSQCKTALLPDAKFCPQCGTPRG